MTRGDSILIVEDFEDAVPALQIALESRYACPVHHARDGTAALIYLEQSATLPLAVITDLNLPLVDGFELIRIIRNSKEWSRIPIIVISAETTPGVRNRVLTLGANEYFAKPYSPAAICTSLESILHDQDQQSSAIDPSVSPRGATPDRADSD